MDIDIRLLLHKNRLIKDKRRVVTTLFLYLFIFINACDFKSIEQWETPSSYYDFSIGIINTNLKFEELLNDSTIFDSTSDIIYVSHIEEIPKQGIPDSIFNINLESVGIEFPDMGGLNGPYDIPVPNISQSIPIDLSNEVNLNDFTDCFPTTLASTLLPAVPIPGEIDVSSFLQNDTFNIIEVASDSGGWALSVTNNLPFPITLGLSIINDANSLLDTESSLDNIGPGQTRVTSYEINDKVINLRENLSYELTAGATVDASPSDPCTILGIPGWPITQESLGVDFAIDFTSRLESITIDGIDIQDSINTGFELPEADGFAIKKAILAESALVPPGPADPDTNMLLLDINNETPIEVNLEFELFNFWKDNNGWVNLSHTGTMEPNSSISPDDDEGQINFYGHTFVKGSPDEDDAELSPIDSINFKMLFAMDLEEEYTIEVIDNQITLGIEFNSIEIRNMHFDYISVITDSIRQDIPTSSTALDGIPDAASHMEMMDLILEFEFINQIGIPMNINLELEGTKVDSDPIVFPLQINIGAPISSNYPNCDFQVEDSVLSIIRTNKDYQITEHYCDATDDPAVATPDFSDTLNFDGVNEEGLVNLINLMPENINFSGDVLITGEGIFSKRSEIWGNLTVTTPLSFIYKQSITMLTGENLMEPMDQAIIDDIDSTLIQGEIYLKITNRSPVGGALSILISDNTIFPLFIDSLVTGSWDKQLDFNTAIWDTLESPLVIDSVFFTAMDPVATELKASEVQFFNNGSLQFFITRLIDLQFPRAAYIDAELGYADPAYPGIYTTSVVLDTSLLNLIITDQLRYSNVMVTFEGSPLGIDGSYIPITMQTTNAIEVQAAITIQIDTGALDIEP